MKKLFSIMFMAVAAVAFVGCGESEDPQPKVVVATPTSSWEFVSAVVTPFGGGTPTTKGLSTCDALDAPTFKVKSYEFYADGTATLRSVCGSAGDSKETYKAQYVDGKVSIIDIYDASGKAKVLYFDKIVIDEAAKTVVANQQTYGTAKTIVVTFKLK